MRPRLAPRFVVILSPGVGRDFGGHAFTTSGAVPKTRDDASHLALIAKFPDISLCCFFWLVCSMRDFQPTYVLLSLSNRRIKDEECDSTPILCTCDSLTTKSVLLENSTNLQASWYYERRGGHGLRHSNYDSLPDFPSIFFSFSKYRMT